MAVVDADKTKLERLLTLHPKAHVLIRNERLILYERIVQEAVCGSSIHSIGRLVQELRGLEPTEDSV